MNVLVVDDEFIMREAFSRLFEWEKYGLNQIGQAKNGKEALDIIKENDVDIVITDLKMPVMDGLTLIAETRKIKPQIKFVVMSAYDTFELVKEAYKLGIKDYFLKIDLDAERILTTLAKLAEEIKEERRIEKDFIEQQELAEKQRKKLQKLEFVMSENEQLLREQLLKKLLWSKKDDSSIEQQLAENGITISSNKLRLMVIVFDNYYTIERDEWQDAREVLKFGVSNIILEVLQGIGNVYAFCNLPHEYVLLYSEENLEYCDEFATKLFSLLKDHLGECFGFIVSGGLSMAADGFSQGYLLYEAAKNASDYTFIKGKGSLIEQRDIKKIQPQMLIDLNEKAERFKALMLKLRNSEQLRDSISDFRISAYSVSPKFAVQVRELFYTYYYEILSYIKRNDLYDREKIKEKTEYFNCELREHGTLPELNEWMANILSILSEEIDGFDFVSGAKNYIYNNYARDISLGDVAVYLGISESYLSKLFKEKTGDGFSEYLLKIRMDKAMELMQTHRYKVYEVAEMVGYRHVEYFSRQFKKITGKSPSEY